MFLIRLLRACTAALLVSLAAAIPSLGYAQASAPATPAATAATLKEYLLRHLEDLLKRPPEERLKTRYAKFRAFGRYQDKQVPKELIDELLAAADVVLVARDGRFEDAAPPRA